MIGWILVETEKVSTRIHPNIVHKNTLSTRILYPVQKGEMVYHFSCEVRFEMNEVLMYA